MPLCGPVTRTVAVAPLGCCRCVGAIAQTNSTTHARRRDGDGRRSVHSEKAAREENAQAGLRGQQAAREQEIWRERLRKETHEIRSIAPFRINPREMNQVGRVWRSIDLTRSKLRAQPFSRARSGARHVARRPMLCSCWRPISCARVAASRAQMLWPQIEKLSRRSVRSFLNRPASPRPLPFGVMCCVCVCVWARSLAGCRSNRRSTPPTRTDRQSSRATVTLRRPPLNTRTCRPDDDRRRAADRRAAAVGRVARRGRRAGTQHDDEAHRADTRPVRPCTGTTRTRSPSSPTSTTTGGSAKSRSKTLRPRCTSCRSRRSCRRSACSSRRPGARGPRSGGRLAAATPTDGLLLQSGWIDRSLDGMDQRIDQWRVDKPFGQ